MACNDTLLPIEIEAVKNFLGRIHHLRKNMLESLMGALQEGKNLLDNLKEISHEGTCDSRPEKIKADAEHGNIFHPINYYLEFSTYNIYYESHIHRIECTIEIEEF